MINGSVYFAREERTGLVKIGCSNDPYRRVYQLTTQEGCTVELLAHVECFHPFFFERTAMLMFADRRVRGEWFRINSVDVDKAVAALEGMTPSDIPDSRYAWPRLPWRQGRQGRSK